MIMDYCLLQFDALKFFLGVLLHGGILHTVHFYKWISNLRNRQTENLNTFQIC